MSWDANSAAATYPPDIGVVVWSPCDRFIAITCKSTTAINVLDSVTLQRVQTLEFPQAKGVGTTPVFSPDSRILMCFGHHGRDIFVVSWDLQTGGTANVIRCQGPQHIAGMLSTTYSASGKMVGVRCQFWGGRRAILVFDVVSGVYVHSHSFTHGTDLENDIWTHGESIRFATLLMKAITIWEVGFTSDAIPTEVGTFPAPQKIDLSEFSRDEKQKRVKLLPTPCRIAVQHVDEVVVWDAQNCKYLLHFTVPWTTSAMSFSSDGRFFACSVPKMDVYLWKESPAGYILHQILKPNIMHPSPLFSQNGESIVAFGGAKIWSWDPKGFTAPPPSSLTQTPRHTKGFVRDFSPDGMLAAFVAREDKTVTVLDVNSGVLRLTVCADMEVYSLRVIGSTITVMGHPKVITWDLPSEDRVPGAQMTLEDSTQTIHLGYLVDEEEPYSSSFSPDSCRVVHATVYELRRESVPARLHIYDGSTGELLAVRLSPGGMPFFAAGGRDLWLVGDHGHGVVFRESNKWEAVQGLERRVGIEHLPEGCPWVSSRGYQVTDDWWILDPDGKRLFMLPSAWQSPGVLQRVWKGQFLALVHPGLPEPVILRLD